MLTKEVFISNILELRRKHAESLSSAVPRLFARDAMIRPSMVYSDDYADRILDKLKKTQINACIVIDKRKKFIGIVNEKDVVKLFLEQVRNEPLVRILGRGYRRSFLYKTAKDMVNKNKMFVHKNTPINRVIELICKNDFEYIPVLDNNHKVIGVITPSSLIKLLKDY